LDLLGQRVAVALITVCLLTFLTPPPPHFKGLWNFEINYEDFTFCNGCGSPEHEKSISKFKIVKSSKLQTPHAATEVFLL
jgi:hypothetical protein